MMKLEQYIRKTIKEVLDYDEKNAIKASKSKYFLNDGPISATKTIEIDKNYYFKISYLIDNEDNSLEISFTDNSEQFSLTNKNMVAKILSTVKFQTNGFLVEINKKLLKMNKKIIINKIIIHPTKIKGKDSHLTADKTSRGKIFKFFILKNINVSNVKSDDIKIEFQLIDKIKLGFTENSTFFKN